MDTADSIVMTNAYGWAFINPVRKLWYNLTLTAASAAVAIFVGGLEVLGLLCDRLSLDTDRWIVIRELNENLDRLGFWVVGIFIASWVCSAVVYRVCGYDELAISTFPESD